MMRMLRYEYRRAEHPRGAAQSYVELRDRLSKLTYKANSEQLDLTVRFLRAMIEPPR